VNWGATVEGENNPDRHVIQLGCLLRIADATEAMAVEHNRLIRERDNYKQWWQQQRSRAERAERSNAGLRGAITRMKRKVARPVE
jgi:hypothetical protein